MSDQLHQIEEKFKELRSFEKIRVVVELTRTFEITCQHFLVQWLQVNIKKHTNAMYEHTVNDANSPDIVNCLLINPEKILSTLQLLLPLIEIKTMNDKLIKAYRDVLSYLDANIHLIDYTDFETQIYQPVQQVLFFIQNNIYLKDHLQNLPKLIHLIQVKRFYADEQQQYHQPILQRHSANHLTANQTFVNAQQLTRHEINDSGVDLSEPTLTNPTQQFFLSQNPQQQQQHQQTVFISQKKHSYVGKTASSPIPEHATLDTPARVPLKGVFSAPAPSTNQIDYRSKTSSSTCQRHVPILTKSDEEEEDEQIKQSQPSNTNNNSKPLAQFCSLRYRNTKLNTNSEVISQYLSVEANSTSERNTFIQVNSGMKDVLVWLKHLRLHKYVDFFSQLTYDEMMNLTMEQLKSSIPVVGACKKIMSNIEKLKERSSLLKQYLADIDNGQIDLCDLIKKIDDIAVTPMRSRQLEIENNSDENLPNLITDLLEKVNQQVTNSSSSDLCSKFLLLIDRCYHKEAFTEEQVHLFLQWRRILTRLFKTLSENDCKPTQLTTSYSFQPRRSFKSSVKPMKSSSSIYYPNSISLTKFNSEPHHNNQFLDSHRRIIKSSALIQPTNEETTNDYHQQQQQQQHSTGAYLANHQHQTLTRTPSIGPYSETGKSLNRMKLCPTYSDPNRIPSLMNPSQMYNQVQDNFMPYSQQQQQQQKSTILSHSPPTLTVPIMKKSHSDIEQHDNQTGMDLFCQEITDKAINDDIITETLNVSPDTEQ